MCLQNMITIIIPVYNGGDKLVRCLESIRKQTYLQKCIEIIIVDDDSTDNAVAIAKERFGCRVVRNGTHDPERGKSIGIEYANGEYLFFMDADNMLTHEKWLEDLVTFVVEEKCVGGQAAKFEYEKNASITDKYMALYGCGDPAIFYLHRRDHMMQTEQAWHLGGSILKETEKYYKIKFDNETLPTIGSQGFLIKKEFVQMINWKPFFYHIDSNADLIRKGYDNYIVMKSSVIHNHSENFKDFMSKIKRNSSQLKREDQYRSYSYNLTLLKLVKLGLVLGTIVIPLKDSIVGFFKFPSAAWFLHPIVSFRVAMIYSWDVLTNRKAVNKIS